MDDRYVMSRRDLDYVRWKHKAQSSRQLVIIAAIFFVATLIGILIFGLLISGALPTGKAPSRVWKTMSSKDSTNINQESYTFADARNVTVTVSDGSIRSITVPGATGHYDDVITRHTSILMYGGPNYHYSSEVPHNLVDAAAKAVPKLEWPGVISRTDEQVTFSKTSDPYVSNATETRVSYYVTLEGEIETSYVTETEDSSLLINVASATCINLSGKDNSSIAGHTLTVFSDFYWSDDTASFIDVTGTSRDFREPVEQLGGVLGSFPKGITYVLRGPTGKRRASRLHHSVTGRTLMVYTDQPCARLYIDQSGGSPSGICVETRGYPDDINNPLLPQPLLFPGTKSIHTTWLNFNLH